MDNVVTAVNNGDVSAVWRPRVTTPTPAGAVQRSKLAAGRSTTMPSQAVRRAQRVLQHEPTGEVRELFARADPVSPPAASTIAQDSPVLADSACAGPPCAPSAKPPVTTPHW